MNLFKHLLAASAMVAGAWLPASGWAQADHNNHDHTSTAPSAGLTEGVVKKVDREASRITLQHGEIKHLEMPAMTMAFTIKDKRLLATAKPGDKVRFQAAKEGGKLVVTDIQPLR